MGTAPRGASRDGTAAMAAAAPPQVGGKGERPGEGRERPNLMLERLCKKGRNGPFLGQKFPRS